MLPAYLVLSQFSFQQHTIIVINYTHSSFIIIIIMICPCKSYTLLLHSFSHYVFTLIFSDDVPSKYGVGVGVK